MSSTNKLQKSYNFFVTKEKENVSFKVNELAKITGWSESTLKTYFSKKWEKYLTKKKGAYLVSGIAKLSEEEYLRYMSQTQKNYTDFTKPRFDVEVEKLIIKARESALLALDIYNRPVTTFKSEGFIVIIIIAWTSLLHAIFQKQNKDYYYKEKDGTKKIIDGDEKAWELSECLKQYYGSKDTPITLNLKFLIGLRNKIEHRYVPTIDMQVVGECQAALLNFDDLITSEFGEYFALKEFLSIPLQTSNLKTEKQIEIQKKFQGKQYEIVNKYIQDFRDTVDGEIYQDPKYSFRVFLIPKLGNHKASSDLALEFIKYDINSPEDMTAYKKQIALIKEKKIPVVNPGKLKPGIVANEVEKRIGKKFSVSYHHPIAYKFYQIRNNDSNPKACNTKYCQFDDAHKDFVYTQDWIEYLVEKLSDENEYLKVFSKSK